MWGKVRVEQYTSKPTIPSPAAISHLDVRAQAFERFDADARNLRKILFAVETSEMVSTGHDPVGSRAADAGESAEFARRGRVDVD